MLVAACPNCGAEIRFRSTALPIRVCDFCRSTVLRSGEALETVGTAASVPDDVSPLQIGTSCHDGNTRFEIIGRVRWRWSGGAWSEWLALFDDDRRAWIGEAAGRFMLLHDYPNVARQTALARRIDRKELRPGVEVTIGTVNFRVNDARAVRCIGSEGELPFAAPADLRIFSVDLLRDDGSCASVQKEGDTVSIYVGRYVSLASLRPRNLRAIEGWPMPDFAQ